MGSRHMTEDRARLDKACSSLSAPTLWTGGRRRERPAGRRNCIWGSRTNPIDVREGRGRHSLDTNVYAEKETLGLALEAPIRSPVSARLSG